VRSLHTGKQIAADLQTKVDDLAARSLASKRTSRSWLRLLERVAERRDKRKDDECEDTQDDEPNEDA